MAKKEVKDYKLQDVEKELKNYKDSKDKIKYLKGIAGKVNENIKFDVKGLLVKAIKENYVAEYYLGYDSISEGVEPIYFWILDFMRDSPPSGLKLDDVKKTGELFEASAGSSYYGEMGSRATVMQQRAGEMLKQVNTVVRSVLNLVYDLKEFKIRLGTYDKLHSTKKDDVLEGKLALKGIWMDQVDIKKGLGSINNLAQKLNFVTIRDAFMQVNSVEDIKKLDLNERVKNILTRKIDEYISWEKYSEEELRKRHNIEKGYLKTQVDSLKLYTKWAKPYLKAAAKLGMHEFKSPDIVAAFNNLQMELDITGRKEVKPESVHESFKKIKLDKKYYAVLDVQLKFRSIPQQVRTEKGQHYVQGGRADVYFRSYALSDEDMKILDDYEVYEDFDLIQNLTEVSLKELEKDIDNIFEEDKKKEEAEKEEVKFTSPFKGLGKGFKEIFGISGGVFKFKGKEGFAEGEMKKATEEKAKDLCFILYDVYKKAHGMLTW